MFPLHTRSVIRFGLAVRRQTGKQRDRGVIRFGSSLSPKLVVHLCLIVILSVNSKMTYTAAYLNAKRSGGDSVVLGIILIPRDGSLVRAPDS